LDLVFHALVAEASGNPWFAAFYQHYGDRFRWAARAVSAAGPAWAVADLHDDLLHAIERADPKAATAEAQHTFVDATTRLRQWRTVAAP
jgi:DNA-binding FadR family transcriptional regulator